MGDCVRRDSPAGTERGDTTCGPEGGEAGEAVEGDAVGEGEGDITDRGDTTCGPEGGEAGGTKVGGAGECVGTEAGVETAGAVGDVPLSAEGDRARIGMGGAGIRFDPDEGVCDPEGIVWGGVADRGAGGVFCGSDCWEGESWISSTSLASEERSWSEGRAGAGVAERDGDCVNRTPVSEDVDVSE